MALGSPFGLMHSVSQGIISARGRHMEELQDVENQDFLQTDAAINPGNSGGPLVNMKGEVIGINNSIASNGGGNEGVGFSIPINLARWIMNELIAQGPRDPRCAGSGPPVRIRPGACRGSGHGTAARRLDPRGQPVLAGFAGRASAMATSSCGSTGSPIVDLNHLINTVSMAPIGQSAEVVIWRDRRELTFRVTVGNREQTFAQLAGAASRPRRIPRAWSAARIGPAPRPAS